LNASKLGLNVNLTGDPSFKGPAVIHFQPVLVSFQVLSFCSLGI